MLFGDIDWNQALMKGAVGAIKGGVSGLVLWLSKRYGVDQSNAQDVSVGTATPPLPKQKRRAVAHWREVSEGRGLRAVVVLVILVVVLGIVLFIIPSLVSPGLHPPRMGR